MTDARREAVVAAWARYCRAFWHAPEDLIGSRYPGLEDTPMTADMAREVAEKLASELGSALPK
jgi:hypothetical protein